MTKITEILKLTAAIARLPDPSDHEAGSTGWALAKKDEALDTTAPGSEPRTPKVMLTAQANTLAAIFDLLAAKASNAQHMQQTDGLLRLALKVQAQCVQTLRVLGEIDNPRQVAFVQQANIAHGHQQIINGSNAVPCPENDSHANKLLEHENGKWMDARAASKTGSGNSALEAMGAVIRADD